jgi:hypothetical protein
MAIRDEVTAQKLSVRALGRLVGQHDLRAINDPAWWPSQEMLDKLEVALFGGRGIPREPLVSAEIVDPDRLGTRASRNVQAMEIWREVGGVWTDGLASRLTEAGILAQSTIILDRERGLWVDKRYDEYGFWGSMTDDHGVYLFDRPDPTFNQFVYGRLARPLATGEPLFDRCSGWVNLLGTNLRYISTLLPFAGERGVAPDRVLSIVTSDRGPNRASVGG